MSDNSDLRENNEAAPLRSPFPPLEAERYLSQLEDMEFSDEQAREFLEVLWRIMCGFVELGFGVNSIQRILPDISEETPQTRTKMVQSRHQITDENASESGGDDEIK